MHRIPLMACLLLTACAALEPRPTPATARELTVQNVAVGKEHGCALLEDGSVRCWGGGLFGQLGFLPQEVCFDYQQCRVPMPVPGLTHVRALSAGGFHSCALHHDGTVTCWGNGFGQGGPEACVGQERPLPCGFRPTRVQGLEAIEQVVSGSQHSCARTRQGEVLCWGNNDFGQVAGPNDALFIQPRPVPGVRGVLELAALDQHTCALLADGTVKCWGRNDQYQLGAESSEQCAYRHVPLQRIACGRTALPVAGLTGVRHLAVGSSFSCALLAQGTVRCWGGGGEGQLGVEPPDTCSYVLGTGIEAHPTPCSHTPRDVPGVEGASALTLSGELAYALRPDGSVVEWGNLMGHPRLEPDEVSCLSRRTCTRPWTLPGVERVALLSAGGYGACALTREGRLSCWSTTRYSEAPFSSRPHAFATPPPAPLAGPLPPPACVEERGCGGEKPPPPRCAPGLSARPLEEVFAEASKLVGTRVAVRGPLQKEQYGPCTIKGCVPGTCCNRCSTSLVLGTPSRQAPHFVLKGELEHIPLSCIGDDSGVCCPFALGLSVVAQGIVEETDSHEFGATPEAKAYFLRDATVCQP